LRVEFRLLEVERCLSSFTGGNLLRVISAVCRDAEWCCWIAAHRVFGYVAFNRAIFTSLV
jgi:hypothetical protein